MRAAAKLLAPSGLLGALPGPAPFLPGKLVGERNFRYSSFITDSGGTYRTVQTARIAVSDLTATFGNWATLADPTGDTDNTNSYTIGKCYLEHGGTTTPILFDGQTSVSVPIGGTVRGKVTKSIAVGDTFYIRCLVAPDVAGGKYPNLAIGAKNYPGEASAKNADYANQVGSANLSFSADLFGPCAVTGTPAGAPAVPSIAVIGASMTYGIGDAFNAPNAMGFIYRALYGNRPVMLYALSGESCQRFLTSRGDRRRDYVGPAADYLICNYFMNDMQGGRTLAQIRADYLTMWSQARARNPALKIYQCTATPKTTSTDSWATAENQTVDATVNAVRPGLNAWIRAGAPIVGGVGVDPGTPGALVANQAGHPLRGYFEVADLAETARDSGKWKPNYTADGVHQNATAHQALAAGIDLARLV